MKAPKFRDFISEKVQRSDILVVITKVDLTARMLLVK